MNTLYMGKEDYSNREIDSKFDSIMALLGQIDTQTKKTNGRVNKLERNMLVVSCVVATILFLKYPEVLKILQIVL
jgi:hypothetical protein